MKKVWIFLLPFVCIQTAVGQLSGSLNGTIGPGEFHVVGNIGVVQNDSLTLMPGTTFLFDSAYVFEIYGTLSAVGTETDSIIFTTDTTANPDRWRRIYFSGGNSSGSQLAYCLIEYGHAIDDWGTNGGGVYLFGSSPTLAHCVIRNNEASFGGGAATYNSTATFSHCTISDNISSNDGGGMDINNSPMTLSECIINDNTSGDDGGGIRCYQSSPDITNCTINCNTAVGDGGGIVLNNSSSANLTGCMICGNTAVGQSGGGIYCYDSSPEIAGCTIRGNSSDSRHGGGVYCYYSSPILTNCTIDSNYADHDGGGVNFSFNSSPTVTDCIIRGNTADSEGGGAYCYEDSSPIFTRCTLSGNISLTHGGGVYLYEASPTFAECIFNNNHSNQSGGGLGIAFSSPTISKCTISENGSSSGGGMTCIFASPIVTSTIIAYSEGQGIWFDNGAESQFRYCDIYGNLGEDIAFSLNDPSNGPPGIGQLVTTNVNDDSSDTYFNILLAPTFADTAANDYHLLDGSPCIDAGDPTMLPDSDGTVVDIGAFYFPQILTTYMLSPDSLNFGEVLYRCDSTLSFWIHNPNEDPLYAAGIRVTDTLFFHANPSSAMVPPQDSVEIELTFTPRRNILYLDSVQISFAGLDENETVIVQGTGIYDCHVLDGPASGTLTMDCNPYYVASEVTIEDTDTLAIEAGVDVILDSYSKFVVNGLLLAIGTVQDSIKFTCDTLFNPDRWGGIRFMEAQDSCRLEYCVIEYGKAQGYYPDNQGGGIYCDDSSPSFSHCIIRLNWSESDGSGVYCGSQSSPSFTDCIIGENSTDRYGGGVYCSGSTPDFTTCIIHNNSAAGKGGAVHCSNAAPSFSNCSITENSAGWDGGAIDLYGATAIPNFTGCTISYNSSGGFGGGLCCTNRASPILENCSIHHNTSDDHGGGFFGNYSSSSFVNCDISYNSAVDEGGGIDAVNCFLSLTECTINNNTSPDNGGGMYISNDTSSVFTHCTISGNTSVNGVYFYNSSPTFNSTIIAFSSGYGLFFNLSSECVFEYCDIYGSSVADIGFVGDDPSHGPTGIGELVTINANGDSCDTYMNIFFDPMFIDMAVDNYNLLAGSPCINAGDPDLPLDPDGTIADIGAFYFHSHAPSTFSLLSPANGETVDTLDVTLTWEASSDPDPGDSIAFYRVYLALDSAFSSELDSQDVTTTEIIWEDLADEQTYWWKVKAFDLQGNGTFSNQSWSFTSIASTVSGNDFLLPTEYALYQNYPNPFNPATNLVFDLVHNRFVSLKVYNLLGQETAVLVNRNMPPGRHIVNFNAGALPSGVYFYQIKAGTFTAQRKMVLMK